MAREKTPTSPAPKKRASAAKTSARKKPTANGKTSSPDVAPFLGPGARAALIAEAAYFRAERRGFAPGHETQDWLAAEAEVDSKLMQGKSAPRA
jgi:hypothetical protein